jgi:hypothetical protein
LLLGAGLGQAVAVTAAAAQRVSYRQPKSAGLAILTAMPLNVSLKKTQKTPAEKHVILCSAKIEKVQHADSQIDGENLVI